MKEPSHTCPVINDAQKRLSEARSDLDHYVVSELRKVEDNLLEDIRNANTELRDWGHYWKEIAEERDQRISELEEELENLKEQAK